MYTEQWALFDWWIWNFWIKTLYFCNNWRLAESMKLLYNYMVFANDDLLRWTLKQTLWIRLLFGNDNKRLSVYSFVNFSERLRELIFSDGFRWAIKVTRVKAKRSQKTNCAPRGVTFRWSNLNVHLWANMCFLTIMMRGFTRLFPLLFDQPVCVVSQYTQV
jgi:hypothetical protein